MCVCEADKGAIKEFHLKGALNALTFSYSCDITTVSGLLNSGCQDW